MENLIHLLSFLVILITVFPGIFVFLFDKIPLTRYQNSNLKYVEGLSAVIAVNIIYYKDFSLIYAILLLIIPYFFELFFNNRKSLTHDKIREEYNSIKLALFIMIFCPLSEEIIFRYFIFKHINEASINSIWVFYLISTLAFIFDHFVTQQIKSLYKVPLSLIECWTYAIWRNTFLCVVIHMCYNICVYAHNSSKYKRYY